MPTNVIPFARIPLRRQIIIISPPFPQYWGGTMENSCQLFVVVFNKDASGVSAVQHFRKIELKAAFRPTEYLIGTCVVPSACGPTW
jgi:hypothetical protein